MPVEAFDFRPAEVPQALRGSRGSRYTTTVEKIAEYLAEHEDVEAVELELGDVSVKSALASFRGVVRKKYRDSLRVQQRGGRVYISRRG